MAVNHHLQINPSHTPSTLHGLEFFTAWRGEGNKKLRIKIFPEKLITMTCRWWWVFTCWRPFLDGAGLARPGALLIVYHSSISIKIAANYLRLNYFPFEWRLTRNSAQDNRRPGAKGGVKLGAFASFFCYNGGNRFFLTTIPDPFPELDWSVHINIA